MIDATKIPASIPELEKQYICKTASIVANLLKDNLIGFYLFGSASHNDYIKGESDLDIQIVTESSLLFSERQDLVRNLLHRNHPCPATKLEFVSYASNFLHDIDRIAYDINLNTGRVIPDHVSFDFKSDPSHWFLLDIAMGCIHGINLYGPRVNKVFPVLSRKLISKAMIESLQWFNKYQPHSNNHYSCLCRCYAYSKEEVFLSKQQALLFTNKFEKTSNFINKSYVSDFHNKVLEDLSVILHLPNDTPF